MAFQLQPPNPFDFKYPDEWPKWKRRFEQCFHASGLAASKDEARQVGTLLYCLGEEVEGRKFCSRCGKATHPPGTPCPANGVICKRCKRKGQCFSTTIRLPTNELTMNSNDAAEKHEVTLDPSDCNELSLDLGLDTAFLDAVTSGTQTTWTSSITIESIEVMFKLDTGTEATTITEDTYKLLPNAVLQKPRKALQGPAKQCLQVLGQFQATLAHRHKTSTQMLYVVQGLKTN